MKTDIELSLDHPEKIVWWIDGKAEETKIEGICPHCFAYAVAWLPKALLKVQPDDTTLVCVPALGGCNQGFAFDPK